MSNCTLCEVELHTDHDTGTHCHMCDVLIKHIDCGASPPPDVLLPPSDTTVTSPDGITGTPNFDVSWF